MACFILFCAALSSAANEPLPVTAAETLSGQKLDFPTALVGKPAVCVFAFSKEAGDAVKVWMTKLSHDEVNAWSVAELESAPGLLRGMIRSSMRKATPTQLLARSLVLVKDEKAWKRALGDKQEKLPVVVLFNAAGQVEWTYTGLPRESPYAELKSKLAALPAAK